MEARLSHSNFTKTIEEERTGFEYDKRNISPVIFDTDGP
jgi:hypothetical protein